VVVVLIIVCAVLVALFMVLRAPWDRVDVDAGAGWKTGAHLKVKLRKPEKRGVPAPGQPGPGETSLNARRLKPGG
jgi:hypothetical protein